MVYAISSDEVREKVLHFMGCDLISDINDPNTTAVEAARYAVLNKGHLWRPLIVVRATQIFENGEHSVFRIIPSAAAVEYIHNATLMVDDVQDESDTRRSKPSVWKEYGENTAINCSHYLVGKAIHTVANSIYLREGQRNRILSITGTAAMSLVSGQEKDLEGKNGGEIGWLERVASVFSSTPRESRISNRPSTLEDVIKVYEFKTGVLLSSAAMIGGIAHNAPEDAIQRLKDFGNYLGVAYQIGDDIYDRVGQATKGGKPIGQDEGQIGVVELVGLDDAKKLLNEYKEKAVASVEGIEGDPSHLVGLVGELEAVINALIK